MAALDEANLSNSISFETEDSSEEGAGDAEICSGLESPAVDSSRITTPHKPPSGSGRRSEAGSASSLSVVPRTNPTATDRVSSRGSKENVRPRLKKNGTQQTHGWPSTSSLGSTASFSDSSQIRDAVYSDWLKRKAENTKKEKISLKGKQAKLKFEEIARNALRQERVKCAVEEWSKKKAARMAGESQKRREALEEKTKEVPPSGSVCH